MTQQADEEQVIDTAVDQHDAQNEDQQGEMPVENQDAAAPVDDDAEVVITLGDDSPPSEGEDEQQGQAAPAWLKELRRVARETAKENRELKAKLEAAAAPKVEQAQPKPTLADCDYDEQAFEEKLTAWHEQQNEVKAKAKAAEEQQAKALTEWNTKVAAFETATKQIKVSDFEDAHEEVKAELSDMQRAILLDAISTPERHAQLVYVLGRDKKQLAALASISNPIKYAIAAADLEKKLTVTPRKAPPAPEKVISGRTTAVGVQDTKLARLEAEADRSGDRTALVAYRRQLREQQGK